MMDSSLGQHGIVLNLTFPERRSVVGNDDHFSLALSKCFQSLPVSENIFSRFHHQGKPGIDVLNALFRFLLRCHCAIWWRLTPCEHVVGKRMNLPTALAMAEATLRIHRPAVAFDTCTASPRSWWKAPVATNLRNTKSWSIGGRAMDLLVPWLTVSAIISQIYIIVGRRKRYLSKSSSSVRNSNGLRRSRNIRGRGSRLLWSFLLKNPTSAAILKLLSNNLYYT